MAAIKLEECKIGHTDQFFFDTNVWILLFGTIASFQAKDQKQYSNLLKALLTRESPIFITSMIISEFANFQLRHDFRQWIKKSGITNPDYKRDFVGTAEYKKSVKTVSQQIKNIMALPIIIKVSDNFNGVEVDDVLAKFVHVDFNDSYIAVLAAKNNYKIVTNDGDFLKIADDLDIVSARS